MTALDTFARSAATAVTESVADVRAPIAGVGTATASAAAWRMFRYAAAGAAAGAAVVAVLVVAPAPEDETTHDTTPPTTAVVTTTVPTDVTPTTIGVQETPSTVSAPNAEAPVVVPPATDEPPEAADVEPPLLKVLSPTDGHHLEAASVAFAGVTEPGATVIASGKFAASVSSDGSWRIDLLLSPGANGVVFVASDDAGNTSEVRMTVFYDVEKPPEDPPKDTTTTTKATWEFSASQKYGSCSEPVPYDEFYGKAKPGSTVDISSEFGGGSTVADKDGNYWVKVEFPSAPYGQVFSVKVKDEFGNKKVFEFVSNYKP